MTTADEPQKQLYAHSKRPRWGFAILAEDGLEQRRYQFQDGQLRTFKQGYYELLEPVEQLDERALDIVRDLTAMLRIERGGAARAQRAGGFEDRLAAFARAYPSGFADPRWIEDRREADKRKRQHRDPAIREAGERLSARALDEAIAAGRYDEPFDAARAVIAATDLAGSKDTGALRRLAPRDREAFARALRELLWGDGPPRERFARYLAVLGRTPGERVTWPLTTALPALVHPREQAFVKPSVVRREAQWLAPSLPYDAAPSPELYARMLAMIQTVRARLERVGQAPRDLFDVTDFMALPARARVAIEVEAEATPRASGAEE